MTQTLSNNKRIAKNTLMLYIRMLLIMVVTLYTSRVILEALGVEDFGIYNVVGGVVVMLGFLRSSLSGATSRFITYELGLKEKSNLKNVFRCALSVHYVLAIIILIIAETIGLWFVLEKLVIPKDRVVATFWVYQCAVVSTLSMIISTPYNALIIAHERMSAFAYISIFEAFAKLFIAFVLLYINCDRLIIYSILLVSVQLIICFIYISYCLRSFHESSLLCSWDKNLSKKIFVYAGWTLNGNLAVVGYTQGINILLNLFFGPAVNAARGIATQIQSAVNQFFSNFQMAVRPQIIKSYASGDLDYMHKLIISSSKYSFFLMLLISIPILVNTKYILKIWLGEIPEYTIIFTKLMLITCMNYALSNPVKMAIHATGDLKKFQLIEGTLLLLVVPIVYISLKFMNISAEMVFVIYFIIESVIQFVRVFIVFPKIQLKVLNYFTCIIIPISKTLFVLSFLLYVIVYQICIQSFVGVWINVLTSIVITALTIFFIGMSKKERIFIVSKVKNRIGV